MFVFCEKPDGTPIVIAGPCWPFCCFVTVPLILGAVGAVSYWLILRENSALVGSSDGDEAIVLGSLQHKNLQTSHSLFFQYIR